MKIGAIEIQPVIDGVLLSQLWSTKPIDDLAARTAQVRLESTLGGLLVRTGERVAAAHFPGLRFGRLLPGERTRRWTYFDD